MKKKLDSMLKLLEKAKSSSDTKELDSIEEELQRLQLELNNDIKQNENSFNRNEIEKQLEKLKSIIRDLDSNKNFNNELFNEFKQFIQNRKFK
jgi:hypothetical protein